MIRLQRAIVILLLVSWCLLLSAQPHDTETINDITYLTRGDLSLALDLYRPKDAQQTLPVILAVHGGFWQQGRGDRKQIASLCRLLAAEGYAVVAIDYRLLPQYRFPEQLADVRAAACWIRDHAEQYQFDPRRFAALGVSAGAQLAALLAVDPEKDAPAIACAVDLNGPMDFTIPPPNPMAQALLEQYLGASQQKNPQLYAAASPITHVTPDDPPFLIIHGTADPVVPFTQATSMRDALQAKKVAVTFYQMKGIGHEIPPATSTLGQEVMRALLDFLSKHTAQKDVPVKEAAQAL